MSALGVATLRLSPFLRGLQGLIGAAASPIWTAVSALAERQDTRGHFLLILRAVTSVDACGRRAIFMRDTICLIWWHAGSGPGRRPIMDITRVWRRGRPERAHKSKRHTWNAGMERARLARVWGGREPAHEWSEHRRLLGTG